MLLTSLDGASLELRPTGYEFAQPTRGSNWGDDEWDPNWLVVHGEVRTAQGDAWSFDDPCLTTWEARELAAWLRDAAEGRVAPTDAPTEDSPGLLGFVEPAEAVTGRPVGGPDQWALYAYSVPLALGRDELRAAARVWEEELSRSPSGERIGSPSPVTVNGCESAAGARHRRRTPVAGAEARGPKVTSGCARVRLTGTPARRLPREARQGRSFGR